MAYHNETFPGCNKGIFPFVMGLLFLVFVLPLHILIGKILWKDAQLTLPRHKIMLSLTASDSLQIFSISCSMIAVMAFSSQPYEESACNILNGILLFFATTTMTVSSLSIITLSIERYISCIYSFYIHQIMTTKRVIFVICTQWLVALGFGAVTVYMHAISASSSTSVFDSLIARYTTVLIVIPSATIIIPIQLRLFIFSRSKLVRIPAVGSFGNAAELVDFRKRQLKVTFVASIVAIAYIVCMLPLAISFALDWKNGVIKSNVPNLIKVLALSNTLADPLVYGIGIADTRKLIWKNIKAARDFLFQRQ